MKIIAVSGGFDPIHIGHIKMLEAAKRLGDKLVVILNNDNWIHHKKGYVFMPENERAAIIRAIRFVDEVIVSKHPINPTDTSVCEVLETVRPHIFANGGDRKAHNIPEYNLCRDLNIKMVFNVGGDKTQSSSELIKKVRGTI